MQELTFETILRLPQMELKKTLKAELKSRVIPSRISLAICMPREQSLSCWWPTWTQFTASLSSRYAIRQMGQ